MKMRAIAPAVIAALSVSCSGHSSLTTPSVSGSYEFVITSNVTGGVTLVEANLAAGGNQSSASGANQVQILTLENKIWYVNGSCTDGRPGQNSVSTSASGSNIALAFDEGGRAFSGQGTLTGTSINASYSITGSACPDLTGTLQYPPGTDQGGIGGNQVPGLAGTFSGSLNLPNGTDNAALTLTESPDHSLTVSAALTGTVDNGTFTLNGTAIGNVMFVSGSVSGHSLSLFGYYDRAGTYTKLPNSLLVFDYDTGATDGLLLAE
jgi:hypothetical protein